MNSPFFTYSGTLLILPTVAIGFLLLRFLYTIIYNLYFHTFSSIPGPKLWGATRLTHIYSSIRGELAYDVKALHEKYGPIVRLAPDEISFAKEEAWHEVLGVRPNGQQCIKDPVFFTPPPGQSQNIVGTPDIEQHARMRRTLNPAFTSTALRAQEPILESYVDLLISQLEDKAVPGTSFNIVDWLNYTSFDIAGDLTFGESFNCLRNSALHPWIAQLYGFIKCAVFASIPRYYPWLDYFLSKYLVPKSLLKMVDDHQLTVVTKVHKRFNFEKQRPDFMTPILEQGILSDAHQIEHKSKGMTLPEIESTFANIIIAGSETVATTLSGLMTYLLLDPSIEQRLHAELHSHFTSVSQIRISALYDLPYLNAVVSEGLRLCTPLPGGLPRMVPGGGMTICGLYLPEGTHVSVSSGTMLSSAEHFHQPDMFVPERWFSDDKRRAQYKNDRLGAIRPFGHGPRACLGKQLALAEMRLVLARLIWGFELQVPEGGQVVDWKSLKCYFVIEKEEVPLSLKAREDS